MWASDEVALEGPGDPEEGWMTCSLLFSFSGKLLSQIGGTGGGGGEGGGGQEPWRDRRSISRQVCQQRGLGEEGLERKEKAPLLGCS